MNKSKNTLKQIATRVLIMPRHAKQLLVMAVDISVCLLSVLASFYLRLGEIQIFCNWS